MLRLCKSIGGVLEEFVWIQLNTAEFDQLYTIWTEKGKTIAQKDKKKSAHIFFPFDTLILL